MQALFLTLLRVRHSFCKLSRIVILIKQHFVVGHLFKSRIQRTFGIFPLKHWSEQALYQEKCAVYHMVPRISNT